ncbi:cyclase family protein [uncultured Methanoregula sp.]|uniref:cyclase family protein n=1 Tax=uncultured Methanoregula sp. TaxID=1005933 RepID=UPI002AAADA8E|nr:cyclase family protein [uncultured Methanoregula sp.]
MEFIDISVGLHPEMPVWPHSRGFHWTEISTMKSGSVSNDSKIECDVHVGTHVDAPAHFIRDGLSVEKLRIDTMIGPCLVLDMQHADAITASLLEKQEIPEKIKRVLIKTKNSGFWHDADSQFRKDFVAVKPDAAEWFVRHDIKLVGIDYLSIQCFGDGPQTHQILLAAGIIVLEGLDLFNVNQGEYDLICLPLKIIGAEGAPARAVLKR